MTLTNEEFKTRVSEIFADGSPITDDKFAELSEAITQLQQPSSGGGRLTISVPDRYKNLNSGLESRIQMGLVDTNTGQDLSLAVGPWYNSWIREIYASFPRPLELMFENKTYVMPEDFMLSHGPTNTGGYNNGGVIKPSSRMAWRVMLAGTRAIYAVNWNKPSSITVWDEAKGTKNTYYTSSLNNQLPEELKTEGLLHSYNNAVNVHRWDVGRLTDNGGGTLIVERAEAQEPYTLKIIYEYSIYEHSSGVKFNEEGKFRHGEILNIYAATFIEEYEDPQNSKKMKRRITRMW